MGIYVRNATRAHKSAEIIAAAIGMTDPYGNPFRVGHLTWTEKKPMYTYAKTVGFEDAILTRPTGGGRLSIEYRDGSIKWYRNSLTGVYTAPFPVTPRNVRILAAMYKEGLFRVQEPDLRSQIDAEAQKMYNRMTIDEKQAYDGLCKSHWSSMYKDGSAAPKPRNARTADDEVAGVKAEVFREKEALEREREELNRQREELESREAKLIASGGMSIRYNEEYLSGMKIMELKRLFKETFGEKVPRESTKQWIIARFLMLQSGLDPEKPSTTAEDLDLEKTKVVS